MASRTLSLILVLTLAAAGKGVAEVFTLECNSVDATSGRNAERKYRIDTDSETVDGKYAKRFTDSQIVLEWSDATKDVTETIDRETGKFVISERSTMGMKGILYRGRCKKAE